jgi:hypothetical protein
MFSKTKKIIAVVLIFSQLALWPGVLLAQAVPTSSAGEGNNPGGVAGMLQNTAEAKVLSSTFTAYQACLKTVQLGEQTASKSNVLSTVALLTNDGQTAQLNAMKILDNVYETYFACAQDQYLIFTGTGGADSGLPASSLYTSGLKQQYVNKIDADWTTYLKKQSDLEARISNANQGFWKTFLISTLLTASKSVADTLVTKLVNNYKISNFKQYADSAATLMYDNQFIRQNFPNAEDQLMARAILNNPLLRTQIQPGIFVAANAALGFNPAAMNPSSANFYGQMAAMGSPAANPYYLQTAYVGGVDQSRSASLATAQQQISQGSGYKAPVNCAGTLNQQQQIDSQAIALQNQLANRQALLTNLQQAQAAKPGSVSNSDLLKATSDYNAALNAWNNAPDAVTSSSGSTSTDPAIIMCEAISSPAVLVNQGIDSVFKAVGGNLTQYNSNNLPSYINVIDGIVSQIADNLVLGGASAGANSALLNENKAVAATVALAAQNTSNNAIASSTSNPILFYSTGPDSQNNYALNWNVNVSQLTTASYVLISGGGNADGTTHQPVYGSITVNPTSSTNYTLTVYDPTGKILSTTSQTVPPPQQSYNYNPNSPAVLGAYTGKPVVIEPRGPAPQLSLR